MMRTILSAAILAGLFLAGPAAADPSQTILDNLVIYLPYDEGQGTDTVDHSGNDYHGKILCQMYNPNDESTVAQWGQPINNDFWVAGKWGFGIDFREALFLQERDTDGTMTITKSIIDAHILEDGIWSGENEVNARNWSFSFWVKRLETRLTNTASSWVNAWSLDPDDGFPDPIDVSDPLKVDWWSWDGGLETDLLHSRYENFQPGFPANRGLNLKYSGGGGTESFNLGSPLGTPGGNGNGQWQNIIITVVGNPNANGGESPPVTERFTGTVYVNGVEVQKFADTGSGWGWMPVEAFVMGSTTLKGIDQQDVMDDVAAWNRILTADEIAWIQNNPIKPTDIQIPANAVQVDNTNLVAWYHFEEGPGATIVADLATAFPAADATAQNSAAIIFDNSQFDPIYQPSLTVGNVFSAQQPDPLTGTYFAASGAKFGDPMVFQNGFTLAAWIKPADDHANWGIIATKGGYDGMYVFFLENGGLHALIQTDYAQSRADTPNGRVPVGVWSHVAVVWDPNTTEDNEMKFYVNGQEQLQSGLWVYNPEDTLLLDTFPNEPFMIGNPYANVASVGINGEDLNYRPFRGGIDDVRLYNRPLTSDEVLGLKFRWCTATGDLTGDCNVNMADIDELSAGWQSDYTITDLSKVALDWLKTNAYFPAY